MRASPAAQFRGDARSPVTWPRQRNAREGSAQIQVASAARRDRGGAAIEAGPAHPAQLYHPSNTQSTAGVRLFRDLPIDCGLPWHACSIRGSSMRCKHPFKKSIASACWPILRSNSAIRPSGQRRCPLPGNAGPGPCRNARRPWCNRLGFTSNARAISPGGTPSSSRPIAAHLGGASPLRDLGGSGFLWVASRN
jgi:hypothetical protein